ncbi:MAG: ATP-dependent Clp protease ATP-binding subunit [Patescibacteria group bacterium]|nr:ATP-dependent Clp protease ATP-binding subunit [Patescibacteria group bacterium]
MEFTFNRRIVWMSPWSRSLARIISYSFLIIILGATVAFLISESSRFHWLGILLTLFLIDYAIHFSSSHYKISQLFAGKVPQNNVALCLNRQALGALTLALERALLMREKFYLVLALFLLEKDSIAKALEKLEINISEFKNKLEEEIEKTSGQEKISLPELKEAVKDLVTQSAFISKFHLEEEINLESLFCALFFSDDPSLKKILDLFSLTADDINAAIVFSRFAFGKKSLLPATLGGFALRKAKIKSHRVNRTFTSRPTPFLDNFSVDLTDLARRGDVGFLIGHQKEYERMINILSGEGRRNVLLVGEAGIGKESLVQHLAFQIINDNVPAPLFDKRLVKLSLEEIMTGAGIEELTLRLRKIIEEIVKAGNIILYLPDIHLLAKTSQEGAFNLSDAFLPIISSSLFPVIGATYPKEFKMYIESHSNFASQFEVIRVEEISLNEAITLLTHEALLLERKYRVSINFSAIKQAVFLASKYFKQTPLPSSAQDLLKETLSFVTQTGQRVVDSNAVISVAERKINVPLHRTRKEEAQALLNLEETIHQFLIDQEEAVKSVANALRAFRAGLSRRGGPIAAFLFVGPTGVGKTELSKILAQIHFGSEKAMLRFDMSEYQEKASLARFIGSPDGKIAGSLTEGVIQRPYCLILLDEFEKAHPDILNIFLQVFDDGRLTDSLGRVVDFQNTIIIATSNACSVFIQEQISAGKKIEEFSDELKKKLVEFFRPELLNRFSDIIVFKPLSLPDLEKIAELHLKKLSSLVSQEQGIELSFSSEAVQKIARLGYDPVFGARPLRKAIDDYVKSPLSEMILAEKVTRGGKVKVELKDDQLVFSVS